MTLGFDWRKKFFVGWQYTLCVLASLFETITIWENKQKRRATSETDFKNVNVSWCPFLGFHTHLRGNLQLDPFWDLQKECLREHDPWVWLAQKSFLLDGSTHYVCLQACLGPYPSEKINRNIARRLKQILRMQTSADAHFSDFIPISEVISTRLILRPSKNVVKWSKSLTNGSYFVY